MKANDIVNKLLEDDSEGGWPTTFSRDVLLEILLELDFEANHHMTVAEVDFERDRQSGLSDDEVRAAVAGALGIEDSSDSSLLATLTERYPDGTILSHNSPFHQWGGNPDDDDESDDEF